MKTLLTIILSVISLTSYSQNYSLLNTNRQCLFNDGNYCLRIDSISASNGDTSYFNYRQISGNEGCYKYSHTSWLGKFVTKKSNGVWNFVNANDNLTTEYNGSKQLRLQLLESKKGTTYLAVDTFKPKNQETPDQRNTADLLDSLPF
jgi:hypothetical protein